jgi:hypothetical protein
MSYVAQVVNVSMHISLDADLLLTVFKATLHAVRHAEDPATKATLIHKLYFCIGDRTGEDGLANANKVQDLLRHAGVFVCALDVLTALVPTLDPSDEDQTDVIEGACSLVRAATDENKASQAAADAAGLRPILVDLARAGPTEFIRSAAGAALIGMDVAVPQ